VIGFFDDRRPLDKTSSMPESPRINRVVRQCFAACDLNAAMASVPSRRSCTALSPAKQLNDAVEDFQKILTEDQRTKLKEIKSIPDADAVLVFTAELDYSRQDRKGRSIATRLHSVLQSVRDFSAVIDTFVSSNPEIAALVWGSVKLTIQVCYAVNPLPNASR